MPLRHQHYSHGWYSGGWFFLFIMQLPRCILSKVMHWTDSGRSFSAKFIRIDDVVDNKWHQHIGMALSRETIELDWAPHTEAAIEPNKSNQFVCILDSFFFFKKHRNSIFFTFLQYPTNTYCAPEHFLMHFWVNAKQLQVYYLITSDARRELYFFSSGRAEQTNNDQIGHIEQDEYLHDSDREAVIIWHMTLCDANKY